MKIHAIKSFDPSVMGDNLEEIIHILETLSMNHLPSEVKIFVKTCDSTAHQYNQRTLIGASDSIRGRFLNILDFINDYSSEEWEVWIVCQQQPEPGHETVNQQHFTIQDAANIGLGPDSASNGRGCWICPLGRLYVPVGHSQKVFHEALLTIANKGSHPIHVNLIYFELSPNKIHAIKSIKTKENLIENIIHILHNISLNFLPHEVEMFIRNCNTTKHQYKRTLIGSSDCLRVSSNNPSVNLGNLNLDFFIELILTPEDWKGWHASRQKILDKFIAEDDYDPWIHHSVGSNQGYVKGY